MIFSNELIDALHQTSCGIVPDLDQESQGDPVAVAEMTLDVMGTYVREVCPEIYTLVTEHGYDALLEEASKHVATN